MVVVEAPNSVAACGFEHVLHLNFPHEVDVAVEEASDQLFELVVLAET